MNIRTLTLTLLLAWAVSCAAQTGVVPPDLRPQETPSTGEARIARRPQAVQPRPDGKLQVQPRPERQRQVERRPTLSRAERLERLRAAPRGVQGNQARPVRPAPARQRRAVTILPAGIPDDFAIADEGIADDVDLMEWDPDATPALTEEEKLLLRPGGLEFLYGRTPVLDIRIHAIRTANDYGTDAATITPQQVEYLVHRCNLIYAKAGIRFQFDPATDFESRNSTLLNQDCSLAFFGEHIGDPTWDPKTADTSANHAARTAVANEFPGQLVVFFRWGTKFVWSEQYSCWKILHATGGFSGGDLMYVAMTYCMPEQNLLAHETGHYLHLHHPFRADAPIMSGEVVRIDTVQKAAEAIRYWVEVQGHSTQDGLEVFDGDSAAVYPGLPYPVDDTPPDVAGGIFVSQYGEGMNCGPYDSIWIYVSFSGGYQACYQLTPDRLNIMSYFKHCHGLGLHHFSEQQIDHMRAALLWGNRHVLL